MYNMKLSEFFSDNGWCKKAYARAKNNREVDVDCPSAVKFSMNGALLLLYPKGVCDEARMKMREKLWKEMAKKVGSPVTLCHFNDTVIESKEELIKFLRKIGE